MIEIKFTGVCEDCRCADLVLDKTDFYSGDVAWNIFCTHAPACKKWLDKITEGHDAEVRKE